MDALDSVGGVVGALDGGGNITGGLGVGAGIQGALVAGGLLDCRVSVGRLDKDTGVGLGRDRP